MGLRLVPCDPLALLPCIPALLCWRDTLGTHGQAVLILEGTTAPFYFMAVVP